MATTTNFQIRKIADNEGDKPQAVNDALDDVDAALQTVKPAGATGTVETATQRLTFVDGLLTTIAPL